MALMGCLSSSKMPVLLLLWNIFVVSTVQVHGRSVAVMADDATSNVTKLVINGVEFPPKVKRPFSTKSMFLAGAGERGLLVNGKFVVFTAIGIYLEDAALPLLAGKWKGKSAGELAASDDFFHDIFAGAFDKFTRVSFIQPLTGPEYSSKVAENMVNEWKAAGTYDRLKQRAIDKFLATFKDVTFSKGASVFFSHLPIGALTIAFSPDGSVPKAHNAVVGNSAIAEAVLESIIGKNGVSPAAKSSLATRLAELLNK